MTKGATPEEKEAYGMVEPRYFNYLNVSSEYNADGINDVEEYADMKHAMDICQILGAEKQAIFSIVAAILHLGNVTFVEGENGVNAVVRDTQTLAFPAYLLVSHLTLRILKSHPQYWLLVV